jgi:hypothetical protein
MAVRSEPIIKGAQEAIVGMCSLVHCAQYSDALLRAVSVRQASRLRLWPGHKVHKVHKVGQRANSGPHRS